MSSSTWPKIKVMRNATIKSQYIIYFICSAITIYTLGGGAGNLFLATSTYIESDALFVILTGGSATQ